MSDLSDIPESRSDDQRLVTSLDRQLQDAFRACESRRYRIEGALGGFGQGHRIAGELRELLPTWFNRWLEESNWMELCINQGYEGFFRFVEAMGQTRESWWEKALPHAKAALAESPERKEGA